MSRSRYLSYKVKTNGNAYINDKKRKKQNMEMNRHILPFYMTYPITGNGLLNDYQNEDTVMRDLEYLQQMYPEEAKRCQKRICQILDKLDYEGSMIYDEYPDKCQLYQLRDNILSILKREAQEEALEKGEEYKPVLPEKWEWLSDMIQILMFYEIYKRRHAEKRSYFKF